MSATFVEYSVHTVSESTAPMDVSHSCRSPWSSFNSVGLQFFTANTYVYDKWRKTQRRIVIRAEYLRISRLACSLTLDRTLAVGGESRIILHNEIMSEPILWFTMKRFVRAQDEHWQFWLLWIQSNKKATNVVTSVPHSLQSVHLLDLLGYVNIKHQMQPNISNCNIFWLKNSSCKKCDN